LKDLSIFNEILDTVFTLSFLVIWDLILNIKKSAEISAFNGL